MFNSNHIVECWVFLSDGCVDGHTVGKILSAWEVDRKIPFFEGFVLPKTAVSVVITLARGKFVLKPLLS